MCLLGYKDSNQIKDLRDKMLHPHIIMSVMECLMNTRAVLGTREVLLLF